MNRQSIEKWMGAANELAEVRTSFSPPVKVLLGEAVDVARFVQAYWEPVRDASGKLLRPGLSLAGPKLLRSVGDEILELEDALQAAQTDYLLTVAPSQPDVRARAEFVLGEITSVIDWYLDDGKDDDRDKQLAALRSEYSEGTSSTDVLAAALADYAGLARREATGLEGLGGFELSLIDEAEQLAQQLRERSTLPTPAETTRRALDVRNRMATLLIERMSLVRTAARFVFRHHSEIAKEAGSSYVRRKRAAARRAAAAKGKSTENVEAASNPVETAPKPNSALASSEETTTTSAS